MDIMLQLKKKKFKIIIVFGDDNVNKCKIDIIEVHLTFLISD